MLANQVQNSEQVKRNSRQLLPHQTHKLRGFAQSNDNGTEVMLNKFQLSKNVKVMQLHADGK